MVAGTVFICRSSQQQETARDSNRKKACIKGIQISANTQITQPLTPSPTQLKYSLTRFNKQLTHCKDADARLPPFWSSRSAVQGCTHACSALQTKQYQLTRSHAQTQMRPCRLSAAPVCGSGLHSRLPCLEPVPPSTSLQALQERRVLPFPQVAAPRPSPACSMLAHEHVCEQKRS